MVVETKANDDDTPLNRGKLAHALEHFRLVNSLLESAGMTRRYSFHIVSPTDYDRFFAALGDDRLDTFTSSLQAMLMP